MKFRFHALKLRKKVSLLFTWILWIYLIAIFSSCLSKDESTISTKDLKYLKDKYDVETINYFYETVFHEDHKNEKTDVIIKWNSNPTIAILGNPNEEEVEYVKRAISEINDLNLPIKCSLAETSDSASTKIFFGNLNEVHSFLELDSVPNEDDYDMHFGMGRSFAHDGIIEEANIGIYYTEKDLPQNTRYKVVLEEIIQSLGITGDSYNYPSSLFFENYNPAKSLTPLDVDLLSLLYEPVIPANYLRASFEKNFADELYAVNTHQKIKNLLDKCPTTSREDIEKCFFGDVFLKHPKEINLYLYGSIVKEDTLTIERAVSALNKLSSNINIKIAQPTTIEPKYGIVLVFRRSEHQKSAIHRNNEIIAGRTCMFPKIIKNKVLITFSTSEIDQELRQRSIIDAIYFSLIQMPQEPSHTNELFKTTGSGIEFTPRYANLLKLVYSNEFLDGLKLSDFNDGLPVADL